MELISEISLTKIKKIEIYQNTARFTMVQIQTGTGADYIINGGIYSFKTFQRVYSDSLPGRSAILRR